MATRLVQTLICYLHRAAGQSGEGIPSDPELLQRWTSHRDETAFELLV